MNELSRKSEEKLILKSMEFKTLYPKYMEIIKGLVKRYPFLMDEYFEKLVNFKKNKETPLHGWFDYKHGYSMDLVKALIERNSVSLEFDILDPFCGVGTTNLVAQTMGYSSIGFDVSPLAIQIAEAKTAFYSKSDLEDIDHHIDNFALKGKYDPPKSDLIERAFKKNDLNTLLQIKNYYEEMGNRKVRNFFKSAYLSVIEDCSNRVKDGNGLKIKRNKVDILDIENFYKSKVQLMLKDIKESNLESKAELVQGSFIELGKKINSESVGLTITSPPYANCFDYFEVYKLELWMGGYVKSYDDFFQYRKDAIRSHVNAKFDHSIENDNPLVDLIAECISCFNIWNKNIPDMIRGYFDDMEKVLKEVFRTSISGAKSYIVVANSSYKGILVPTDLLLCAIAESIGFIVEPIIFARKIRASSQQTKEIKEQYSDLQRESILVFRKP